LLSQSSISFAAGQLGFSDDLHAFVFICICIDQYSWPLLPDIEFTLQVGMKNMAELLSFNEMEKMVQLFL